MTNPIIRIHNVTTGEIIDREMTNAELQAELNPPSPLPLGHLTEISTGAKEL